MSNRNILKDQYKDTCFTILPMFLTRYKYIRGANGRRTKTFS